MKCESDCIVCVVKVLFDVLPYLRRGVYPPRTLPCTRGDLAEKDRNRFEELPVYHLMVGYNSSPRHPLLLTFKEDFADRDRGGLLPVCPFVPLLQVPGDSFKNKSLGLVGLQRSGGKCAGLKPGVVEAFEVELVALAEVSMQDVQLVLGEKLMGGCVLPMFHKFTAQVLHEGCVELVQGQTMVQAPFS